MKQVLFFITLFSSLFSNADCTSLVGKYTCSTPTKEVIYLKSALLNGERFFKINDLVKSYDGKLVLVEERIDKDGNSWSNFTKNSCENDMLIDFEVYQAPGQGSFTSFAIAKKLYALDQFGDLIILEGAFETNQQEKFDVNNPRADIKKVNCYRD